MSSNMSIIMYSLLVAFGIISHSIVGNAFTFTSTFPLLTKSTSAPSTNRRAASISKTTPIQSPIPIAPPLFTLSSTALFESSSSPPGDKVRESNGKRPSLTPTIVNAVSEALLQRSTPNTPFYYNTPAQDDNGSSTSTSTSTSNSSTKALELAIAAGNIAQSAILKRAETSNAVENDATSAFNQEESQLVAGRVVGVVMRFQQLEELLLKRVVDSTWVVKYNEEGSFGITPHEVPSSSESESESASVDTIQNVMDTIKQDPLVRMCRAECLYALFLKIIEMPTMERIGQIPVDGTSGLDFLDDDRMQVLFPDGFE